LAAYGNNNRLIHKDEDGYHTYGNGEDYAAVTECVGIVGTRYRSSSVLIDTVDPDPISTAGGHLITLTGTFPVNEALPTRLGLAGDSTDPLCYGGQGYGYSPVSLDGLTLEIVSPPCGKGTATITITYDDYDYQAAITVVERSWAEKLHTMRRNFSPWKALGARRLDNEGQE
jgi:hypothetical protein